MDSVDSGFYRANYRIRKLAHRRWQRGQCKQQILRSQVGFADTSSSRPGPCAGCENYHGVHYGTGRNLRLQLVCGVHPYGWQGGGACPDWLGSQ